MEKLGQRYIFDNLGLNFECNHVLDVATCRKSDFYLVFISIIKILKRVLSSTNPVTEIPYLAEFSRIFLLVKFRHSSQIMSLANFSKKSIFERNIDFGKKSIFERNIDL